MATDLILTLLPRFTGIEPGFPLSLYRLSHKRSSPVDKLLGSVCKLRLCHSPEGTPLRDGVSGAKSLDSGLVLRQNTGFFVVALGRHSLRMTCQRILHTRPNLKTREA